MIYAPCIGDGNYGEDEAWERAEDARKRREERERKEQEATQPAQEGGR